MIATPQIENRAVAQQPASEVVCLVNDDPMVLRSIGRFFKQEKRKELRYE
jgi:hypothetical protein